jgi:ferrochelatase
VSAGVLVMAHGTPSSAEQIEPFYTRIRRGRAPDAEQLAELESRYRAIGGVSPLAQRTAAQLAALRSVLEARRPGRFLVAFGAKHTEPLIEEAAARLAGTGALEHVVGLVLTPHGSSMGSQEYLERAAAALGDGGPRLVRVPPWYGEPGLVALLAERVREARASIADAARGHVLFTAHSLPARVIEGGDTYADQVADSARLVAAAARLADGEWSVAWQSAGRTPEPWIGPDARDEVRRLSAARRADRVDAVVVCPIGFVADHLEVLYDLDVELAAVAAACGVAYARTRSLNDDPAFIEVLGDVVERADERADEAA